MVFRQHPPAVPVVFSLLDVVGGAAIGDALAMPIAGLSHQNVRMYYKGIKGYTADEKRGTPAGTGTAHTARLLALARGGSPGDAHLPPDEPYATAHAAATVAPLALRFGPDALGPWLPRLSAHADARAAALAHAHVLARLTGPESRPPVPFDSDTFWAFVRRTTADAETTCGASGRLSDRLARLDGHLGSFPLDLQDLCDGSGEAADEAWPFALAMFARAPDLVEATLLSAINAGGDAPTVGALVGGLLGARHGWAAFPDEWRGGLAVRAEVVTLGE